MSHFFCSHYWKFFKLTTLRKKEIKRKHYPFHIACPVLAKEDWLKKQQVSGIVWDPGLLCFWIYPFYYFINFSKIHIIWMKSPNGLNKAEASNQNHIPVSTTALQTSPLTTGAWSACRSSRRTWLLQSKQARISTSPVPHGFSFQSPWLPAQPSQSSRRLFGRTR